jgi:hypothetical protein
MSVSSSVVDGVLNDHINQDTPIEPFSSTCELAIIKQAAVNGFYEYLFQECMDASRSGGKVNMLGEPLPTSFECMSNWIIKQPEVNAIPDSGRCRQSFEFFVQQLWQDSINRRFDSSSPPWDYTTEALTITDEFIQKIHAEYKGATWRFQDGYRENFLGGGQQCSPKTVRELARKDFLGSFVSLFETQLVHYDRRLLEVGVFFDSDLDGGNAFCYDCYHGFIDIATGEVALYYEFANDEFKELCAIPTSEECLRSGPISDALHNFRICAGYDILFQGPMCSAAQVDAVASLSPSPYYMISQCAFNPTDPVCSTMDNYWGVLKEPLDEGCMICYTELADDISAFAKDPNNQVACGDNVEAPLCIATASTPLLNFLSCSGFFLSGNK